MGIALAQLYFTDNDYAIMNIPNLIKVYTYDNCSCERIEIEPHPTYKTYMLAQSNDYEIEYKKELIFTMKSEIGWKIGSKY